MSGNVSLPESDTWIRQEATVEALDMRRCSPTQAGEWVRDKGGERFAYKTDKTREGVDVLILLKDGKPLFTIGGPYFLIWANGKVWKVPNAMMHEWHAVAEAW